MKWIAKTNLDLITHKYYININTFRACVFVLVSVSVANVICLPIYFILHWYLFMDASNLGDIFDSFDIIPSDLIPFGGFR